MNKQILKYIIFAGIFAVPFVPLFVSSSLFFPFITTKAFAFRTIVEIVFATWVLLALLDKEHRPKKSLVLYSVLAFLAVIGLADLFGAAPMKSFWSNFERMDGFVSLLHLGAFFVVIASVFDDINWKRWWNTTLIASLIMILYSALQIFGFKVINQGGVRVDGTLGNATYLAVYMLLHFFIALFFLYRSAGKKALVWLYGILLLLQVWVIYHTATRGAILGLLGGLVLMAILSLWNKEDKKVRRAGIVLLVSILVLAGGFWSLKDSEFVNNSPVLSRFSTLSFEELRTQGRYFVWPMAIEGFKERPILGWGQENFTYVFQKHYVPEMYRLEPWFDRAHNIFLDWLVVGGILGLLSYLSLYVALLYMIWRSRDEDGSDKQTFSYGEKTILTGLIASYFFHNFFVFDNLVSYILFFALLAYVHSRGRGNALWQANLSISKANMVALPIVAVLLVSTLYYINYKPLKGNVALIDALKTVQTPGEIGQAPAHFEDAYNASRLGRVEAVEHTISNSVPILSSESLSLEEKNSFYNFAKEAINKEGGLPANMKESRFQLVVGSFFTTVGSLDEALVYLERAKELIPGKPQVYLELANLYIHKGDIETAIETLQYLASISPDHKADVEGYIRALREESRQ